VAVGKAKAGIAVSLMKECNHIRNLRARQAELGHALVDGSAADHRADQVTVLIVIH
jgi:hypothetical protein